VLHGVTSSQLQKAVGIHRVPGKNYANFIDPKYITPGRGANPAYITPNTTPGTIGSIIYLHGPHAFYQDLSASKTVPIRESVRFRLQAEFLNAWNHPVFGSTPDSFTTSNTGIQSTSFGRVGVTNQSGFGRIIELRGNVEF